MDALSALAPFLRVRPEIQDFCRFGGSWQAPHDTLTGNAAQFHIVASGQCDVDLPGQASLSLRSGSILLLPHGDRHVMRARTKSSVGPPHISTGFNNAVRTKATDGTPTETEIVCGLLHFESASRNLLIAALPDTILVDVSRKPILPLLRALVTAIRDELDNARPGAGAIANDLASALFTMLLRQFIEADRAVAGSLALLSQPVTAKAVGVMLADPARDWSLDMLADAGGASRATLVRSFRRLGAPAPLEFLTDLRLSLAMKKLREGSSSVAQIAAESGYQSEGALSRAMLRRYGVRPGAVRVETSGA